MADKKKKESGKKYLLLLLLLLLIGGLFLAWFLGQRSTEITQDPGKDAAIRAKRVEDSIKRAKEIADSLYEQAVKDSLDQDKRYKDSVAASLRADSTRVADSLEEVRRVRDSLNRAKNLRDSANRANRLKDSIAHEKEKIRLAREQAKKDSIKRAKEVADSIKAANDPCVNDTIIPWVYPKPAGGLHPTPVKVKFVSTEKCEIKWKFEDESEFKVYDGKPFVINKNRVLLYSAVDPCGNSFSQKRKRYEIAADNSSKCPKGMAYIPYNGGFCIDKYEWPNKPGRRPISNVSFSQASDSCFTIGKRLCEAAEWESCCRGPYNWNYPYGATYLSRACVTQSKAPGKSGRAGECRGWYGVYDLVGNLSEWTATPSTVKKGFFVVKGGFWDSGTRSSCKLSRHSYFPQNPHNPVGFRCCKDVDE